MPFPNQHAARMKDPSYFEPDSMRTKKIAPGISMIMGKKKGGGDKAPMETQSYRFDKDKFTPAQAKAWLKDHDVSCLSFEPASEKAKEETFPMMEEDSFREKFKGKLLEGEDSPEGKRWRAVLIKAGTSLNKNYYSPEVLKEALPQFEGCRAFVYEDYAGFYHAGGMTPPDELPTNLVGFYENAAFDESLQAITADFCVTAEWLKETLRNAWELGKKDLLGFSIDAEARDWVMATIGGEQVRKASGLHIFEVTVVTDPAAGGELLKLLESAAHPASHKSDTSGNSNEKIKEEKRKMDREKILEALKNLGAIKEGVDYAAMTDEELMGKLLEASNTKKEEPKAPAPLPAVPAGETDGDKALAEAKAILAQAQATADKAAVLNKENLEAAQKVAGEALLEKTLQADKEMPEDTKVFIKESFKGKRVTEAEMNAEIKRHKDHLARLQESGSRIRGLGDQRAEAGKGPEDAFQARMDYIFGVEPKTDEEKRVRESFRFGYRDHSLKRLYVDVTGDEGLIGVYSPEGMKRLREQTTADFTHILGVSMNRKAIQDFQNFPQTWRQVCDVVPFDNLKQQVREKMGGFTALKTVSESDSTDYPTLATPLEQEANFTPLTKGGIVRITEAMLINDDLKKIREQPQLAALAAFDALEEYVFDLLINASAGVVNAGTTTYDSLALYHANHFNLISSALSYAQLKHARKLLMKQRRLAFSTTINDAGGISDADASFVIATAASGLPKAGDVMIIGSEKIYVGAASGTTVSSLVRGYEGTTAASHADAATIYFLAGPLYQELGLVICPPDLVGQIEEYWGSEKDPDSGNQRANVLYKGFTIVNSPRLRADDNVFVVAKGPLKAIEMGFLYGKDTPDLVYQGDPSQGDVFNRDNLRWKVKFRFGGAQVAHEPVVAIIP